METVKVSVIVPNYNHSNYLRKRLDSIFNQTFQNFEVILLDDASTDNSIEIFNEYNQHPKVSHFIINEINSGSTFKQWKKGIELACGEYIWIAESDDWADIYFLEILLNVYYQNNNTIALAFCGSNCIDGHNNPVNIAKFEFDRWNNSFIGNGNTEIKNELIFHNSICNASSILFIRRSLKNIDFSNYLFCGDWKTVIDIIFQKKFAFTSKKLNYYRIHSNGVTFKISTIEREIVRFREYIRIMKYALIKINLSPVLYRKRHRWIIFEWLDNIQYFSTKPNYYFPPFPIFINFIFYLYLLKRFLKRN
jgi:glycosyltransferase involved in cell wall biosynthesis